MMLALYCIVNATSRESLTSGLDLEIRPFFLPLPSVTSHRFRVVKE